VSDESSNSRDAAPTTPAFLRDAQFIELDGKRPLRSNWNTDPSGWLDADQARVRLAEGKNVGIVLRAGDLVVDVDVRSGGEQSWKRLKEDLSLDLAGYPVVRTGSGGLHVYMRLPEGARALKGNLERDGYPGVDLKSVGGQVVAPGSTHSETGRRYEVLQDLDPLDELSGIPEAPKALVELVVRLQTSSATAGAGSTSPERLAAMLEHLPVEDYREHGRWLELMMACHSATGGAGREAFVDWSVSDPEYAGQGEVIARRWDSLDAGAAGGVTERTLEKHLVDAGVAHLVEPDLDEAIDDFSDIDDLPEHASEAAAEAKESMIDRINASRFTVLTGGRYLVGRERYDPRLQRQLVDWNPDDAVRKHMNIKSIETAEGKVEKLGDWWLKNPGRRQYDWVIFDPAPGEPDPAVYNLWRGWAVQPKPGDWSLLKQLVRDVLCAGDQASYDYVMRWSAFMVQRPSTPAEVALVFKGRKGTGKGTFGRALKGLAGQHGRQVAQPDHFTGRFNEHLMDTILLFVDEGLWAGDKKVEGVLKNLITEPVLTFEGKNKPIIEGPNHLHILIASNEDWVIPASPDERRFAVFEADHEAAAKLPAGFFAKLNDQMNREGGRAAMLDELLKMPLGDWHPRRDIPQTGALTDQKVQGFRQDPIAFWWYRALEDGDADLTRPDLTKPDPYWPDAFDADSADKQSMLDNVNHQARQMGKRAEYTKTALARFLGRVGVDVKARDRKGSKVWHVPALDEARRAFEEHVGGSLDWDAD
jgi:hypothetical protein